MSRWQAIVFDLDDTLYPEHDYVRSGFAAVAAWAGQRFGLAPNAVYQALHDLFRAGIRGDTFNRWVAEQGLPTAVVSELITVYRDHTPQLQPFSFIPSLLQQLRPNVQLGLVSDGYLAVQQRKWAALGLAEYFAAVVFSDQWGRAGWKPSPQPFLSVLEQLALTGSDVLYIGDNPRKDFRGARQVKMATLWVRYAQGDYSCLLPPAPEYAPDFVVDQADELITLFRRTYGIKNSAPSRVTA